nr:iron-containing alcohol dehydrogenase [Sporolactobacillus inulinus]
MRVVRCDHGQMRGTLWSNFFYKQPVPVDFGFGKIKKLPQILKQFGFSRGLLISAPSMVRAGIAQQLMEQSDGKIITIFSEIQPNPTVLNTDACAMTLRDKQCDFAIALGGGSIMDCAKAACFTATTPYSAADFCPDSARLTTRAFR